MKWGGLGFYDAKKSHSVKFHHWPFKMKIYDEVLIQAAIKGTPGYENKLIFIDSQLLLKTKGATFNFMEKLGNRFLPGQFWPCLSFASLSVPSGMAQSPDFWSCGPQLRPLYCCDLKLCCGGVGRWGLIGSLQLLSQLKIMHLNSKIISQNSDIAQNEFLLAYFL